MKFSEYLRKLDEGNLGQELEKQEADKKKEAAKKKTDLKDWQIPSLKEDYRDDLSHMTGADNDYEGAESTPVITNPAHPDYKANDPFNVRRRNNAKELADRKEKEEKEEKTKNLGEMKFPSIRPNESDKDKKIRDRMKAREEREKRLKDSIEHSEAKRKANESVEAPARDALGRLSIKSINETGIKKLLRRGEFDSGGQGTTPQARLKLQSANDRHPNNPLNTDGRERTGDHLERRGVKTRGVDPGNDGNNVAEPPTSDDIRARKRRVNNSNYERLVNRTSGNDTGFGAFARKNAKMENSSLEIPMRDALGRLSIQSMHEASTPKPLRKALKKAKMGKKLSNKESGRVMRNIKADGSTRTNAAENYKNPQDDIDAHDAAEGEYRSGGEGTPRQKHLDK